MNTRQIRAIRKLFLAYGQPGTVEIHNLPWIRENPHHSPLTPDVAGPHPVFKNGWDFYNTKSLGALKQLAVSSCYKYLIKWKTPDMNQHQFAEIICTDLTDLKNPKFEIYKEETANAPA